MVVIRNRLSMATAGGPRQFAELRDKVLVRANNFEEREQVLAELDEIGLRPLQLNNAPILAVEPQDKIEDTIERLSSIDLDGRRVREGVQEIQGARDAGEEVLELSETALQVTQSFLDEIQGLQGVSLAEFVQSFADYGPENLRFNPGELDDLTDSQGQDAKDNLESVVNELGIPEVWETTRGENSIVAIFDTGFAEDLIDDSRIVGTFHGGDAGLEENVPDSVYKSSEGHGTMTAGAAAANKEEGVPFDGAAPDAGVILVRITDSKGQIRSDITSAAWDWLIDVEDERPIVANHSYGIPLCSGRPRTKFCDTVVNDMIKVANSKADILSCYAAGNEAMRCGHRLIGATSAVTGTNSLGEVVTVGALLTNGQEAQRYSSHGRGDCSPVSDPKPNVSCRIPKFTYYGGEDGYKIKDMSTGPLGSSGGTSHASPLTCGMLALLQSAAVQKNGEALQTEEVKNIIHRTANPPRKTQVNSVGFILGEKGYDARFGHGEINITDSVSNLD